MCSELTPRARIPDSRIPQFMQPWSCPRVLYKELIFWDSTLLFYPEHWVQKIQKWKMQPIRVLCRCMSGRMQWLQSKSPLMWRREGKELLRAFTLPPAACSLLITNAITNFLFVFLTLPLVLLLCHKSKVVVFCRQRFISNGFWAYHSGSRVMSLDT